MDGLTRLTVLPIWAWVMLTSSLSAQQPPAWFDANAAPVQESSDVAGFPKQALPPILAPAQAAAQHADQSLNRAVVPASFESDLYQQPESLAAQLANLGKRIDALEKPSIKYPANVQVLGVFQADGVTFNQDAANKAAIAAGGVGQEIQNGGDFRRARLAARATLANNMNAFFQMDFAFPGRPTFTDVWVEWTDLPVLGTVRVGQWKQPFSLEVVSSFRYTTFMERSSLFQAFTPFRHIGIGAYNHADDL